VNKVKAGKGYQESMVKFNFGSHLNSEILHGVYIYIHISSAARLLRSWVESHRGHGCLSVVSVVCCQVEVSATS